MTQVNDWDFIKALPKTDLHVHLDGSLRLNTLIQLAKEQNVTLPSYSEEGLRELVFKDSYNDLGEYLQCFAYTCAVLQTPDALEQVAYELAVDNQNEGVRYIEVRYAPQLHINENLDMMQVLQCVDRGLRRARHEFNHRPEVRKREEPPFEYGIIVTALRMFRENFSEYYAKLIQVQKYAPSEEVYGQASLELARAAVVARDEFGLPIVGLDLAGQEAGYPPDDHIEAYDFAHRNFLKKTVHAGEVWGPESIMGAITDLHTDRIGHGYYLLDSHQIQDPTIYDREDYVRRLGQYVSDRRITVEVCLTSNLQTMPHLKSLREHAMQKLYKQRLSVTLCTDNRLVSNTTVTREIQLGVENFDLTRRDLYSVIVYGFKRSFYPGTYLQKRRYVREIIDYYKTVEKRFFPDEQDDSKTEHEDDGQMTAQAGRLEPV